MGDQSPDRRSRYPGGSPPLIETITVAQGTLILVSNEVGLGIVLKTSWRAGFGMRPGFFINVSRLARTGAVAVRWLEFAFK